MNWLWASGYFLLLKHSLHQYSHLPAFVCPSTKTGKRSSLFLPQFLQMPLLLMIDILYHMIRQIRQKNLHNLDTLSGPVMIWMKIHLNPWEWLWVDMKLAYASHSLGNHKCFESIYDGWAKDFATLWTPFLSSSELRHSFSVLFRSQNSMNNSIVFHISHPVHHRLSTVFRAL